MTIAGSSIYGDSAQSGDAVANYGGTLTLGSSVLYSNSATASGGAVFTLMPDPASGGGVHEGTPIRKMARKKVPSGLPVVNSVVK